MKSHEISLFFGFFGFGFKKKVNPLGKSPKSTSLGATSIGRSPTPHDLSRAAASRPGGTSAPASSQPYSWRFHGGSMDGKTPIV